jgi:hypothetical protein
LEELSSWEERSFDSLRSLPEKLGADRTAILIGCVERSFVAMLLRTDSLIGFQERSLASDGRSGQTSFIGCLVSNKTSSPLCFS